MNCDVCTIDTIIFSSIILSWLLNM